MNLRTKLILAFMLVTLLPFGVMLLGLPRTAIHQAEQLVGARLEDNVLQASRSIDQFMINCIRDLKAFASDEEHLVGDPAEASKHLAELTYFYPYFDQFVCADVTGNITASSNRAIIGQSLLQNFPSLEDEFRTAINGTASTVYVSDFSDISPAQQALLQEGKVNAFALGIQLLAPVFDDAGQCRGVIVGEVVTHHLHDLLEDIDRRIPGDNKTVLVDKQGRLLISGDDDAPLLSVLPELKTLKAAGSNSSSAYRSYTNSRGQQVMSGYAELWTYGSNSAGGWILVATAPYDIIMKPVSDALLKAGGGLALVLAVATLLGLWLAHTMSRPVLSLTRGVAEFAQGNFSSRVPTTARGEIGALAIAFNNMAATIQQQVAELRSANDDLEMRVAERTSELAQINANLSNEVTERTAAQCQLERTRNELAEINVNLEGEISERRKIEEALRLQQQELRILFDLIPAFVWFKDTKNRHLRVNRRAADAAGRTVEEMEGEHASVTYPEFAEKYYADDLEVIASKKPRLGIVECLKDLNNEDIWIQTDKVPYFDNNGEVVGIIVMAQDITERRRSEERLKAAQQELVEVSRHAGMAEVATSVLHNVGNVLNSVNVTTTLLSERLTKSKAVNIGKVAGMLQEHQADLGDFITRDPKGKQLPGYLATLADHLAQEQAQIQQELKSLQMNVEHIKDIVAMQQTYAKVFGVSELVTPRQLVEDALHLNAGALIRHEVAVSREFEEVPPIMTEKHKVLQILVNLIRNAKYACDEGGTSPKEIVLGIALEGDQVLLSIKDNGIGIPQENLERIFAHGFTTRAAGHGFGLHNSALVAKELGGSLVGYSKGIGYGATFILRLPYNTGSEPITK